MWDSVPVQCFSAGCNPVVVTVEKIELTEGMKISHSNSSLNTSICVAPGRVTTVMLLNWVEFGSTFNYIATLIHPRPTVETFSPGWSFLFFVVDGARHPPGHNREQLTSRSSPNVQRRQEVKNVYTESEKKGRREEIMKFNGTFFCTSSGA